jgi:hypothetical protein
MSAACTLSTPDELPVDVKHPETSDGSIRDHHFPRTAINVLCSGDSECERSPEHTMASLSRTPENSYLVSFSTCPNRGAREE